MVMADDLVFMAAGSYHTGPVAAQLPSHLFLFAFFCIPEAIIERAN